MFLLHFIFGTRKEIKYSYIRTLANGFKKSERGVLYKRMIGFEYWRSLYEVEKRLKKEPEVEAHSIRILSVKRG